METLVTHLDKPTLRTIMMVEQKGDLFDRCVEEMYRDIMYDDIDGLSRTEVSYQSEWDLKCVLTD